MPSGNNNQSNDWPDHKARWSHVAQGAKEVGIASLPSVLTYLVLGHEEVKKSSQRKHALREKRSRMIPKFSLFKSNPL